VCLANSSYLRDFFKTNNVPVFLESKVKKINKNSIEFENKDGELKTIKTDSTIVSVGYVPNPVAKSSKHVHVVGDASEVGTLKTVIWQAWEVAEKL
jgi:2-enoate reductase